MLQFNRGYRRPTTWSRLSTGTKMYFIACAVAPFAIVGALLYAGVPWKVLLLCGIMLGK